MADAAVLREERRRKITENAEARLNKLLGLNKSRDQDDEPSSQNSVSNSQHSEGQPYSVRLRSHGSVVSAPPTSRQIPESATPTPTVKRSSNRQSDDPILTTNHSYTSKTIAGGEVGTVQQTTLEKSEVVTKNKDTLSQIVQGLDAQTLEIVKIVIFVVAALLSRFFLKFDIGLFIVQSIFVPFILLEVAIELFIYNYLQHVPLFTSKSPLMSAALMLCGMKQEILDTYSSIMAHITSWMSDFCLYLFSFIVWNSFTV